MVKNPSANAGDTRDTVQSQGREDALEEDMETHSSILAWKIPWTEGGWWAAVRKVIKHQTQLKRLSTAHTLRTLCLYQYPKRQQ